MGMTGEATGAKRNESAWRMEREFRRYGRIAANYLPPRAPAPIVRRFHDTVDLLHMARRDERLAPDTAAPGCVQRCADQLAYTVRLRGHHGTERDMEHMWAALATQPVPGRSCEHWSGDQKIAWILHGIDLALLQFARSPKGAAAARRKALDRVENTGRRLLEAIDAVPEAAAIFDAALARYCLQRVPQALRAGHWPAYGAVRTSQRDIGDSLADEIMATWREGNVVLPVCAPA